MDVYLSPRLMFMCLIGSYFSTFTREKYRIFETSLF